MLCSAAHIALCVEISERDGVSRIRLLYRDCWLNHLKHSPILSCVDATIQQSSIHLQYINGVRASTGPVLPVNQTARKGNYFRGILVPITCGENEPDHLKLMEHKHSVTVILCTSVRAKVFLFATC